MVAKPDDVFMTVEEYLALEETSPVKHEYVDGHVYAMSGGTIDHDTIANNIRAILVTQVGDESCRALGPDVRVRINPSISYYPDALVTCDATIDGGEHELTTPRLIVEVLSDSTEANDRGDKFANYQTLDTFEEYLLVASRRRSVERFRRTGRGLWLYQRYPPYEGVTLEAIGLTLPIDAFYRRTRL